VVIGNDSIIEGSADENINVVNAEDANFHIINGIVVIPRSAVLPKNTVIRAADYAPSLTSV
jgi:hypothetical protein